MKVLFKLVVIMAIIIGMLVLYRLTSCTTESFSAFGCSKIPFEKLLLAMRTPSEHQEWKKKEWDTAPTFQKDIAIGMWDEKPCEEQNESYKKVEERKNKRMAVDKSM